jgi:hypothetical protein
VEEAPPFTPDPEPWPDDEGFDPDDDCPLIVKSVRAKYTRRVERRVFIVGWGDHRMSRGEDGGTWPGMDCFYTSGRSLSDGIPSILTRFRIPCHGPVTDLTVRRNGDRFLDLISGAQSFNEVAWS